MCKLMGQKGTFAIRKNDGIYKLIFNDGNNKGHLFFAIEDFFDLEDCVLQTRRIIEKETQRIIEGGEKK